MAAHWSPDGGTLAYLVPSAMTQHGSAASADLWTYTLASGEARLAEADVAGSGWLGADGSLWGRRTGTLFRRRGASVEEWPRDARESVVASIWGGQAALMVRAELDRFDVRLFRPGVGATVLTDFQAEVRTASGIPGLAALVGSSETRERIDQLWELDDQHQIAHRRTLPIPANVKGVSLTEDGQRLLMARVEKPLGAGTGTIRLTEAPVDAEDIVESTLLTRDLGLGLSLSSTITSTDRMWFLEPLPEGGGALLEATREGWATRLVVPETVLGLEVDPTGTRLAVTDADLRVIVLPLDVPDISTALVERRGKALMGWEVDGWDTRGERVLVSQRGGRALYDPRDGSLERMPDADQVTPCGDRLLLRSPEGYAWWSPGQAVRHIAGPMEDAFVAGCSDAGRRVLITRVRRDIRHWRLDVVPVPER
ncbi:MAG: hypothetical protein H6736_21395 [Alphaproteobacteria bacterium]|nr:hypothetical protein [Alphaproteobacteria bacterium]MCB9694373.1 hypothetical protein [Alphaproteobacteria bacterium]